MARQFSVRKEAVAPLQPLNKDFCSDWVWGTFAPKSNLQLQKCRRSVETGRSYPIADEDDNGDINDHIANTFLIAFRGGF